MEPTAPLAERFADTHPLVCPRPSKCGCWGDPDGMRELHVAFWQVVQDIPGWSDLYTSGRWLALYDDNLVTS